MADETKSDFKIGEKNIFDGGRAIELISENEIRYYDEDGEIEYEIILDESATLEKVKFFIEATNRKAIT